jgi:hypothetical protein
MVHQSLGPTPSARPEPAGQASGRSSSAWRRSGARLEQAAISNAVAMAAAKRAARGKGSGMMVGSMDVRMRVRDCLGAQFLG